MLTALDDPANLQYCCYDEPYSANSCYGVTVQPPAEFRAWNYGFVTSITNSTFIGNVASCKSCAGGAISIQPGGDVSVTNCIIANNSAQFFGGGMFIGGPSPGYPSCSLNLTGTAVTRNVNSRSGNQLYASCGGSIDFTAAQFEMMNTVLEVSMRPRKTLFARPS